MDDPRRATLVITSGTGGTFSVQIVQQSGTTIDRQSGMAVTAGGQVTFTPSCPAPSADGGPANGGTEPYVATATTFALYESNNNDETRVEVYMKR